MYKTVMYTTLPMPLVYQTLPRPLVHKTPLMYKTLLPMRGVLMSGSLVGILVSCSAATYETLLLLSLLQTTLGPFNGFTTA